MSKDSRALTTLNPDSIGELIERNQENNYKDLPQKKRAFAIAYVSNGYDHGKAATSIGHTKEVGAKYKRDPLTASFIRSLMNKYEAESLVTKQTLDVFLDNLEDVAMGRVETVDMTSEGDQIQGKVFHPALALKIYQERAKLHDVVKDGSAVQGGVSVTINMNGMITPVKGETIEIKTDE